ncbi:MAG: tRNA (guanosine(46)-N7)-methyltransferase TrmB [Spirochaetaceae bacterium]|jgi:tRNA (guanine-N7-)-methyltransferase|nr:tRNA (guanosine(46)-N7)-methyltransferase TrmB [Spirochaetaceae bacterium]
MEHDSSIRTYVRRSGHISNAQQRAYTALSAQYGIPFSQAQLDFAAVFGNSSPVIIEIGFGMGTATVRIAQSNPSINYLGIEVHKAGIGKLFLEIEKRSLHNVLCIEYDAVAVVEAMIPDGSAAGFHIFFPDPWPKKRHHKRRLVTRPFTDLLAAKLKGGGFIYMVTDWLDYAQWAYQELSSTPCLCNAFDGFAPAQEWRPRTNFEERALALGHGIQEIYFVKQP